MPRKSFERECCRWVLLSAALLGICGCDKAAQHQSSAKKPVSLREFTTRTHLKLPRHIIRNYCFDITEAFTEIALARFDIATADLPKLLSADDRMPAAADLSKSGSVAAEMVPYGEKLPWWDFSELGSQLECARREGTFETNGTRWIWCLNICVTPLDPNTSRVYLLYLEEPGPTAETRPGP